MGGGGRACGPAPAGSTATARAGFRGMVGWDGQAGDGKNCSCVPRRAPCSCALSCAHGKTGVGRPAQPARRMPRAHGALRPRLPTPPHPAFDSFRALLEPAAFGGCRPLVGTESDTDSALVGVDLGRHDGCREIASPMKKARRTPAGFFVYRAAGIRSSRTARTASGSGTRSRRRRGWSGSRPRRCARSRRTSANAGSWRSPRP